MNRKHYNILYDAMQELLNEYNPCEFKDGACARYRAGYRWPDPYDKACCGGSGTRNGAPCKHLTNKGCRVKSLWCKTWLCGYAIDRLPLGFKLQWKQIKNLVYSNCPSLPYRDGMNAYFNGGHNQL